MDKATKWLVEQYQDPAAAYSTEEWARMAGVPTKRVYRWFVRKKFIEPRTKGEEREEHVVTRDAIQGRWPDFWRSVRRRLADIAERSG